MTGEIRLDLMVFIHPYREIGMYCNTCVTPTTLVASCNGVEIGCCEKLGCQLRARVKALLAYLDLRRRIVADAFD